MPRAAPPPRRKRVAAPLLVAEARLREAEALRKLGEPLAAEAASEAARALYRAAGDRIGEAAALTISGRRSTSTAGSSPRRARPMSSRSRATARPATATASRAP